MHEALLNTFSKYPSTQAPFMYEQLAQWSVLKPLQGLKAVHHVPLVENTLLKIACLLAAGADLTVTNPHSFCQAQAPAISCLEKAGIRYVPSLEQLGKEQFDLYFDCGAQLHQFLGRPAIGAVELTGSGDQFYRQQLLDFPVISVDRTLTKQLETVFGCAQSCHKAITQLTGVSVHDTSWVIFGFGKIGRGVAYFCTQANIPCVVVEVCDRQRLKAHHLGLKAISASDWNELEYALSEANVIITATGQKAILNSYPKRWFEYKILANLGVYDEFGPQFTQSEVLNNKMPVNFILHDPTPMKYIDPEFFIHNDAALLFQRKNWSSQVHDYPGAMDKSVIERWCIHHDFSPETIYSWFVT